MINTMGYSYLLFMTPAMPLQF